MTRRRELEEHRHKLGEIRGIMNSMKTLAYMETRKLGRFLDNQQAIVDNIEAMAADFVSFFPQTLSAPTDKNTTQSGESGDIYLLIGSERGFCGNFNDSLLPVMDSCATKDTEREIALVAVGHKLHTILESDPRATTMINGANVIEEVEAVLTRVIDTIARLLETHPDSSLYVLYHSEGHIGGGIEEHTETIGAYPEKPHQILMKKLLPPFQSYLGKQTDFAHPPILNVLPADFLQELTDHYLFSALHEILYTSLMAENHRRVQHLEGAVQHMDEKSEELGSQCNALRQEEIIEEIEVILLSAESLM